MELYVENQLKEKIDPINALLETHTADLTSLFDKIEQLDSHIRRVDKHYNGVSNAILIKLGVKLKEINELNILREYQRQEDKRKHMLCKLTKQEKSPSPVNLKSEGNATTTNFMTRLAPKAQERRL